jgi:hypothetical protein
MRRAFLAGWSLPRALSRRLCRVVVGRCWQIAAPDGRRVTRSAHRSCRFAAAYRQSSGSTRMLVGHPHIIGSHVPADGQASTTRRTFQRVVTRTVTMHSGSSCWLWSSPTGMLRPHARQVQRCQRVSPDDRREAFSGAAARAQRFGDEWTASTRISVTSAVRSGICCKLRLKWCAATPGGFHDEC